MTSASVGAVRPPARALLTVADVALLLKINRRTVLDLIAAGEIRAINVGGTRCHGARWRVSEQDLSLFLESRASNDRNLWMVLGLVT